MKMHGRLIIHASAQNQNLQRVDSNTHLFPFWVWWTNLFPSVAGHNGKYPKNVERPTKRGCCRDGPARRGL